MFIKQLSVFVENKSGKMADVLNILAEHHIGISALSIADTSDFGVLRLIVEDADGAKAILRENGLIVKVTEVIAIGIEHRPGGLAAALTALKEANLALDYLYAFIGRGSAGAYVILKTEEQDKAVEVLESKGFKTADNKEIFGE